MLMGWSSGVSPFFLIIGIGATCSKSDFYGRYPERDRSKNLATLFRFGIVFTIKK